MAVIVGAVVVAGALLLIASGAGHCRRPKWLLATLQAQNVLPAQVHRWVQLLLGPVEIVLGLAVLVGWAASLSLLLRPALAASALLTAAFASYLAVVLRRSPGAPCGCFGDDRISPSVVARAALLAVANTVGAVIGLPEQQRLLADEIRAHIDAVR